jgi:hypothetical protein
VRATGIEEEEQQLQLYKYLKPGYIQAREQEKCAIKIVILHAQT